MSMDQALLGDFEGNFCLERSFVAKIAWCALAFEDGQWPAWG